MMRGPAALNPVGADAARRFETVELRDLDVHQHDVVRLAFQRGDHLQPVAGDVRAVAELREQPQRELLVDGVVLGQQDPQRRPLGELRAGWGAYLLGGGGVYRRLLRADLEQRVQQVGRLDRVW